MKFYRLVIVSLLVISCNVKQDIPALDLTLKIEEGTDSLAWRRYVKRKLTETITSYYGQKLKTVVLYDSSSSYPIEIHSYFMGKLYGHRFCFDETGRLSFYNYYVGNQNYSSYERYYKNGDFFNEQGSILVDYIKEDNKINLLFISTFHDSFKVKVSSPATDAYFLTLKPSSMQPMLLEGSIRFDSDSVYTIVTSARDKERNQFKTYYDTLRMKK